MPSVKKRQWTKAEIRKVRSVVKSAFDGADQMIPGCYPPEEIDDQKEKLEEQRKLVLEFIRDAEKTMLG